MGFRKFVPFLLLMALFLFARGLLAPILPLYFDSVGLSIIDIGLAFSTFGISLLIFEVLWGFIADRINRDLLMPVIFGSACLTFLLFTHYRSFQAILLLQVGMGFFLAGAGVVGRLRIAELAEESERGRAFGVLGSTFGFSIVAGSIVDGAIASRINYDGYFYLAAVFALIPFVPFLLFRVGSTGRAPHVVHPANASLAPYPLKTREPILLGLVAVALFSSWGFFASLMPVIVTKTIVGATPAQAVLTFGLFSASSMIFQPFMGEFGSRRPRLWVTAGLSVNAGSLFMLTVAHTIGAVYLLTFIAGACYATVSPVSLSRLMKAVPDRYLGRALGFYGGAEDVGVTVGPFVGSVVWQLVGVTASFVSISGIIVAILLVYVFATAPSRMRTQAEDMMIKR